MKKRNKRQNPLKYGKLPRNLGKSLGKFKENGNNMDRIHKFVQPQETGEDVTMSDGLESGKRQVNFYLELDLDKETRTEVFKRQMDAPDYTRTKMFNEAMRVYFLILKAKKAMKDNQPVQDFVKDILRKM